MAGEALMEGMASTASTEGMLSVENRWNGKLDDKMNRSQDGRAKHTKMSTDSMVNSSENNVKYH